MNKRMKKIMEIFIKRIKKITEKINEKEKNAKHEELRPNQIKKNSKEKNKRK